MKDEEGSIVKNSSAGKNFHLLKIKAEYISSKAEPGNFIMAKASGSLDPILRRPLGILKSEPPYIWLFFEVAGKGTRYISNLKINDKINLIGPLGNSFPDPAKQRTLLIAGGRGIVPLFFLLNRTRDRSNISLVYGAKSAESLNFLEEIKGLNPGKIYLFTEDGSLGEKGLLTTGIKEIIKDNQIFTTMACGPEAMFAGLYRKIGNLPRNYISMESYMGCGFGVCHSCVITAATGEYKKVCSDGPVFKLEDIKWQT